MSRTILLLTFCFCLFSQAIAQQGGLVQRQTIGRFLNGALPQITPTVLDENGISWELVNTFPNVTLPIENPMHLIPVPNRDKLLLLGDQSGKIFSLVNESTTESVDLILDLEPMTQSYGDSGLMGVALHPDYAKPEAAKNFLYVFYRYTPERYGNLTKGYVRVSRFTWNPGSSQINPSSEQVLINQYDSHEWHQGGGLVFGADGFLYITLGDEGGSNDVFNTTQKIDEGFFSGVLRIDVDKDPTKSHPIRRQPVSVQTEPTGWDEGTYSQNYFIPNDNPWTSAAEDVLEEFYAVGLRNPYRMTRDPVTNTFWIGDVGQGDREEINTLQKGANYQWPYREGTIAGTKTKPPAAQLIGEEKGPIYEYDRDVGGCVVGGYVYRGSLNPELYGKYIFCEYNQGRLMVFDPSSNSEASQIRSFGAYLGKGFGTDHQGELYVTMSAEEDGTPAQLLRLQKAAGQGNLNAPPALLSQTNAFSNLPALTPAAGVVPYDVIQPLWSDGASKKRWLSVPFGNGVSDDKITFSENGNWEFPVGSVLIKHFEYGAKKLETRFTVKGNDSNWYGINYRWNAEGTDAYLLDGQSSLELDITLGDGQSRIWYYPSRGECFLCHTSSKGRVLGLKTRHLNRDHLYPLSGRTSNQLVTLNQAGYFDAPLDNSLFTTMHTASAIGDNQQTKENRVRSYLDINCSHCHTGSSISRARFESDLATPLFWQNMINAAPVNHLGIGNAKVVFPGSTTKSILYARTSSLEGCCAMPPLAKNEVDAAAVRLMGDWIGSLKANEVPQTDVNPAQAPFDITQPSGVISTTTNNTQLALEFSEPVAGLTLSDLIVNNATVDSMTGSGQSRVVSITPAHPFQPFTLRIPIDSFHDLNGNGNNTSIEFSSVQQTIDHTSLPTSVSVSATAITVQLIISTNVIADLVVDLEGDQWLGGGRVTVSPGTSVAVVDIPINSVLTEGEELKWNVFFTQPGATWTTQTKWVEVSPVSVGGIVTEDAIAISAAPGRLTPGDSAAVVVNYQAVSDGFINVALSDDAGNWIVRESQAAPQGSGNALLELLVPEGTLPENLSYQLFLSSEALVWQNARVWGTPVDAGAFSTWASGFGLTGNDSEVTADSDHDLIQLIEEYAYNLNPLQHDQVLTPNGTSGRPLIRLIEGRLQIEFIRRRSDTSLSYRPRFGSSPEGLVDAFGIESVTVIDQMFERVLIRDTETTTTADCRFGAITVE